MTVPRVSASRDGFPAAWPMPGRRRNPANKTEKRRRCNMRTSDGWSIANSNRGRGCFAKRSRFDAVLAESLGLWEIGLCTEHRKHSACESNNHGKRCEPGKGPEE